MGFVKDAWEGITGQTAAKGATKAAEAQAGYQKEALDYLKESEAIPKQFREGALARLGGLYGLEGGQGSQQQFINQAMQSPLYKSIMGGQEAGEESILRNQAMTGGLRSGNTQEALYDYNTQLQNQALLSAYNQQQQGLTGLADLSSYAPQIAQQTSNIGSTYAGGILGAANATQQGQGNVWNLVGKAGTALLGLL